MKPDHTENRQTRRPDRLRCRPSVESAESRVLLSAARVPVSFLKTPISDTSPLLEHIHPHLTIIIDGVQQTIPANIGIVPGGGLPLHTHDTSGRIHVESTRVLPFRLNDFFTVWGQTFNQKSILGHKADKTHKITMTVNGRPSRAFGSLLLQDGQEIVIQFTTIPPKPGIRR